MKALGSDISQSALALIEGEGNLVANLANLSALFFQFIPGLNWAGFYLWDSNAGNLVLGPFQGKPACIRIRPGKGGCGKAYTTRQVQRVGDVNAFTGHIACDTDSRSELVIPMVWNNECVGVLDLDAPVENHFSAALASELEELVGRLVPVLFGGPPKH
jgi:GAF domain-containing protein